MNTQSAKTLDLIDYANAVASLTKMQENLAKAKDGSAT